jgi:Cys-tRNA(Pro)/Cys-tRNA(Cys) deacylase
MAEVDGKPVCAAIPSDCEVSMKKLAATFSSISPFGQKKPVPTAIEQTAMAEPYVYLSDGMLVFANKKAAGNTSAAF